MFGDVKQLPVEKLYNDKGQVAVAISPDFGAGWSTEELVNPMDARFNKLIRDKRTEELYALARAEGFYTGSLPEIKLIWLDPGTKFDITNYDGAETIIISDPWIA